MRRKLRIAIIVAGLVVGTIAVVPAMASTTAKPAASGPSIAQLMARVHKQCTKVSKGNYSPDDGSPATISICKAGTAFVWTADMDVDCDGVRTSKCNEHTDCCFQNDTSFHQTNGKPLEADLTHFYVIPLPSSRFSYTAQGIRPGAVAAIIYKNKMLFATFGDEGPTNIIGEASYATNRDLGVNPDPKNGGTDGPVTYIVFPKAVANPIQSNSAINNVGVTAANAFIKS